MDGFVSEPLAVVPGCDEVGLGAGRDEQLRPLRNETEMKSCRWMTILRRFGIAALIVVLSPAASLHADEPLSRDSIFRDARLFDVQPNRARALAQRKQYAAAIREYDKVIAYMESQGAKLGSTGSDLERIYVERARTEVLMGRTEEGDRDFFDIIAKVGFVTEMSPDDRIGLYKRASARDPKNRDYAHKLADAYRQKAAKLRRKSGPGAAKAEVRNALAVYAHLLETAPDDAERAEVNIEMASVRQEAGDLPGTIADYTAALKALDAASMDSAHRMSRRGYVLDKRAQAYYDLGKYEAAAADASEVLGAVAPKSAGLEDSLNFKYNRKLALGLRAMALLQQGKQRQAIGDMRELIKLDQSYFNREVQPKLNAIKQARHAAGGAGR